MVRSGLKRLFRLGIFRRDLRAGEVDDEIRTHLALRTEQLMRDGLDEPGARAEAERRFGDLGRTRPRLHAAAHHRDVSMRLVSAIEVIRYDVVYAIRQLRHSPALTVASVATLAIGIGANATMFGVVDRLLLRPPDGVRDPAHVFTITTEQRDRDGNLRADDVQTYRRYQHFAEAQDAFAGVTAYARADFTLGIGPDATRIRGVRATASYFSVFGVGPRLGRLFEPDDDGNPIAPHVAVLGDGFWRRHFAADPSVVGRTLSLAGTSYTVIGVAPEGFTGLDQSEVDVWVPLTAGISPAEYARLTTQSWYWLTIAVRGRPEMSPARSAAIATRTLRAGMVRAGTSAAKVDVEKPTAVLTSALPRDAHGTDPDARVSVLLGGVSLLVLLLACANVTSLQLARGLERRREIALRLALGGGRGRLVSQWLVGTLVLGVLGGAAALLVAWWGSILVRRSLFESVVWVNGPVNGDMLAFTALAALVAGIVTGVLPAAQLTRTDFTTAIKDGAGAARVHGTRARLALTVLQASLSILLLIGTGLFVKSFAKVRSLPVGMDTERVLFAQLNTSGRSYSKQEAEALYRRLGEVARTTPGVASASVAMSIPFLSSYGADVTLPGRDSVPLTSDGGPYINAVDPDFFRTVGMRIVRGRSFTQADEDGQHRVAIVNETAARMWWPSQDAIGRCMRIDGDSMPCAEVVGIAANARRQALVEGKSIQFFVPLTQQPVDDEGRVLLIRPREDPHAAREAIRLRLQSAAPDLPFVAVTPLEDALDPQMRSWRLGATMFGAFGILAVILAAVGLYGLLAHDVTQRTRELGVRLALGARPADVGRLVLGQGLRIVALGGAIGATIALAGSPFVEPLLFRTSARDPAAYAIAVLVLGPVALVATWMPARRAVRLDPSRAMHAD